MSQAGSARKANRITPFLWFDGRLEEAMQFYASVFPDSKLGKVMRHGGAVMSASFELAGQRFMGLNGGPHFSFTPAVSFFIDCNTQEEVDELWGKLSDGGQTQQCGWLTDRFGLSWQVIPTILGELLQDPDPGRAQRAMQAMLQMTKIDIRKLEEAAGAVATVS